MNAIAARVPPVAAQITEKEQRIIAFCRSPEFTIEKLRAIVSSPF